VALITSISEASVVDLPDPVGPVGELGHRRRQAEAIERHHVERDQAQCGTDGGALHVGVDAEAGPPRDLVGEVELPVVLELLALTLGQDRVDDLARVVGGEDGEALHRHQATAYPHGRGCPRRDVEVGGPAVNDLEQHVGEIELHSYPSLGSKSSGMYRQTGRHHLRLTTRVDA
jgi:hypothetical protein